MNDLSLSKYCSGLSLITLSLQKQVQSGEDIFETPSIFPSCKMLKMNSVPSPDRIVFKIKTSHRVTFLIEDKMKTLRKRISKSNSLDYVGSVISTTKLKPNIDRFILSFKQTIDLESEAGSMCVDYPTNIFKSFHDCDEHYVYQEMKHKYNLMPFWASENLDEVTRLKYYNTTNWKGALPWRFLLEGAEESNCLRPCRSTKVEKLNIISTI